jgi:hypothetical protein
MHDPNGVLLHDAIGIASSISGMGLAQIKQILSELRDADEGAVRKMSKEDSLDAMVDGKYYLYPTMYVRVMTIAFLDCVQLQ